MTAERLDEVEVLRVLAAPYAGGGGLRDAVEVIINGERLSAMLGGVPLDVAEVRAGQARSWLWGGTEVPIARCGCGDVGCIRAYAEVVRRSAVVEWDVRSLGRRFRFDGVELELSLRLALAAE